MTYSFTLLSEGVHGKGGGGGGGSGGGRCGSDCGIAGTVIEYGGGGGGAIMYASIAVMMNFVQLIIIFICSHCVSTKVHGKSLLILSRPKYLQ